MKKLVLLLLIICPGMALSQNLNPQVAPGTVACTGAYANDTALLTAAATAGSIRLAGNCVINATITLISNTTFNGNGYTVTGATSSAWSGSTVAHFLAAANNATNIVVENTNFICPASATGAVHVIQFPSGNSHVKVIANTFNLNGACGDAEAMVGVTDGVVIGNTALLASNACYDDWNGTQDVEIASNYCSTWTTGGAGTAAYGVLWTGFNTNDSAGTLTTHVNIHDNKIYINNQPTFGDIGIWLEGYSSCTGAAADYADVHDNEIFFATGIWGTGIKADGCANHDYIHDNVIYSDGTSSSVPAIEAKGTTTDIHIDNNKAYNYSAPTSGTDAGVFNNEATGGATLLGNICIGASCSLPLYSGQATASFSVPAANQSYNFATWGVAAGIISSVTMGANGVFTGATSLPVTFPAASGIWAYWPANAICTANTAGVYWTVMSSATAGTVYNKTLTTGAPYVPTSPSAFSCSAGSGTQTTSALRTLITLPVPGNTMGANGNLYIKTLGARTNNGDTVIQEWLFGGNEIALASTVSVNWYSMERTVMNEGTAGSEVVMGAATSGTDMVLAANGTSQYALDTTTSQNLVFDCQINTATDWCLIYGGVVQANYAP